MGEEGKDGACGKTTKGTLTEGASMPSKGKDAGRKKKVEKDKGGRSGACGQAIRNIVRRKRRVEEKSVAYFTMEGAIALWREYSQWGMPIRNGVVYGRSNSDVCGM